MYTITIIEESTGKPPIQRLIRTVEHCNVDAVFAAISGGNKAPRTYTKRSAQKELI